MVSEGDQQDIIEHPDHADIGHADAVDGGIPLDAFWARLDPIEA